VSVRQAHSLDFGPDVLDFEDGRLAVRTADEAARVTAALDEACAGQLRYRLVHGHARACVLRRKLMLEGNAISGRPFSRQDAVANVRQDALIECGLALVLSLDVHCLSYADSSTMT